MQKQGRRAGQNIRELALTKRLKAISSFISAGLVIFLPMLLVKTFDNLFGQLTSADSSPSLSSLDMPPIFYVAIVIFSLILIIDGINLWKRANSAD